MTQLGCHRNRRGGHAHRRRAVRGVKGLAVVLAVLVTCCATPSMDAQPRLLVLAAASLSGVLPAIADETYAFDGSSALVDQLAAGAAADVLVSADRQNMDRAIAAGVIDGAPTQIASNVLVVIAPPGNPAGITGLDASLSGKKLVVCAVGVPCGTATQQLAQQRGVALAPVSHETKVTDVLGKVTSGEADAGIVYATDAKRAGAKVVTLPIPGAGGVPVTYWAAVVRGAAHPDAARAFVARLVGDWRAAFAAAGFGPPL